MLKAMSSEAYATKEFDVGAQLREIEKQVLSVVPPATEAEKLSFVEKDLELGEGIGVNHIQYVRIVLANRLNEHPDQSDFIISRLKATAGKPLERQTYRWSSAYPDSQILQFYETVELDEKEKPVRTTRRGFDITDTERIMEWITSKGTLRQTDG